MSRRSLSATRADERAAPLALPTELLTLVIDCTTDAAQLATLGRVCKYAHKVIVPRLYHTVRLHTARAHAAFARAHVRPVSGAPPPRPEGRTDPTVYIKHLDVVLAADYEPDVPGLHNERGAMPLPNPSKMVSRWPEDDEPTPRQRPPLLRSRSSRSDQPSVRLELETLHVALRCGYSGARDAYGPSQWLADFACRLRGSRAAHLRVRVYGARAPVDPAVYLPSALDYGALRSLVLPDAAVAASVRQALPKLGALEYVAMDRKTFTPRLAEDMVARDRAGRAPVVVHLRVPDHVRQQMDDDGIEPAMPGDGVAFDGRVEAEDLSVAEWRDWAAARPWSGLGGSADE